MYYVESAEDKENIREERSEKLCSELNKIIKEDEDENVNCIPKGIELEGICIKDNRRTKYWSRKQERVEGRKVDARNMNTKEKWHKFLRNVLLASRVINAFKVVKQQNIQIFGANCENSPTVSSHLVPNIPKCVFTLIYPYYPHLSFRYCYQRVNLIGAGCF